MNLDYLNHLSNKRDICALRQCFSNEHGICCAENKNKNWYPLETNNVKKISAQNDKIPLPQDAVFI